MSNDEDNTTKSERIPVLIAEHRILVLVVLTTVIAIVSTGVGLMMYNSRGTAQLDLSRPSYEGVGELVEQGRQTYTEYSASGGIDEESLREFDELYRKQMDGLMVIDAFGGDPLAAEALGIDADDNN